jgi:hypothetical protein
VPAILLAELTLLVGSHWAEHNYTLFSALEGVDSLYLAFRS